ncbi:hypothetical protein ACFOLJ_18720 [Rugamonas sp. CCM 8940]|uniref:hypothetical protein n=1 Tax=Rugamonas sp. CCM 8940 TaxID=2765359 RepID=UPI0018F5E968|nr:hypothetical protein [Rugamonas sp. CCM 8940]MBJ7310780.1 hypothetical protein [Rugamonas sp. CCM 8940]
MLAPKRGTLFDGKQKLFSLNFSSAARRRCLPQRKRRRFAMSSAVGKTPCLAPPQLRTQPLINNGLHPQSSFPFFLTKEIR